MDGVLTRLICIGSVASFQGCNDNITAEHCLTWGRGEHRRPCSMEAVSRLKQM